MYGWLLAAYPRAFRERFGPDMVELFVDQMREARRAGTIAVVRLWLLVCAGLIRTALLEHLDARRQGRTPPLPAASRGRRFRPMEAMLQDLRHSLRVLGRNPVFAAVAILVVALGSGGVTTIFSAMNAILLRPLPGATSPERLVDVERKTADDNSSLSASHAYYAMLRERARTLDDVVAWGNATLSISIGDDAVAAYGNIVTGNFFDVLGTRPALGRFFGAGAGDDPLAESVVVLSHDFWRTRLGGDSAAIGRTVRVNAQPFTLIGVAPPGFRGAFTPLRTDAWVPLGHHGLVRPGRDLADPDWAWLRVFARLEDGVERDAARAELTSLTEAWAAGSGERDEFRDFSGVRVTALSGLPYDAHKAALGFMSLLLGAALLVLLIASVNVAAMLSARALGRHREMALRSALGAARGRLVRQLLTETLLLFALGALGGFAIAVLATRAVERVPVPGDVPIALDLSPDLRVLAFALGIALLAGLLFGLAPALRAAGRDLGVRLREGGAGAGTRRGWLGDALVVGQLALSLVLLVAAGLFLRALDRGQRVDPGFDTAGVVTTALPTGSWGYDEEAGRAFFGRLRERVERLPGVSAVSTAGFLPLAMGSSGDDIEVDGVEAPIQYVNVDRGYFEVLRLPIVRGRPFDASDDERASRVAVVNETLARRHWPDGAIGRTFRFRGEAVRVIGVARDAKYANLSESTPAFLYFPMAQAWNTTQTLLVRTDGDAAAMAPALRAAVRELDPAVPPPTVTTLEREAAVVLLPQRIAALVTGVLGALGLVLAAVGLYGLMAYSAGRRTREIGIRMALGAHRADVLRLMVRHGVRLAATGVALGLLLAAAATRLLAQLLFGIDPLDAVTFAGMSALFLAIALVASYLPARRAAAADPMAVLRGD